MRDEEQIYDLLMGDCVDGIAGTDSRPGILKAGVARAGLTPLLRKILHATGRVAKETGLPLFCHHDPAIKNGGEILDLLAGCGVPASKVILGHSGDSTDLEYLTAMLERGCWLGMDRFGFCDKDLALEPRVDTIAALCIHPPARPARPQGEGPGSGRGGRPAGGQSPGLLRGELSRTDNCTSAENGPDIVGCPARFSCPPGGDAGAVPPQEKDSVSPEQDPVSAKHCLFA